MAGLCSNRPEGFGPISTISSPIPTQCFLDTILVPLPTWLYLLSLPLLFFLTPSARRSSSRSSSRRLSLLTSWRRRWRALLLHGAYYFALAVLALMESVEIAQLARARLGTGLLPFVYAGLAAAAVLQATDGAGRRVRGYWAAGAAFWVGGAAVTGLKIAGVLGLGLSGPLARTGSLYETRHQFVDLVILVVFYLVAIGLEVGLMVLRRRTRRREESEDDVVELRSEFDWK